MSEKPILYQAPLSPPCRAVFLTGAALGIEFDLKSVDMMGGEHKSEDYIKMNPQHTVPLLDDNGVIIADSHAICGYLVDKYGEDDTLYPKDLVKRAQVNSRLHFNSGHVFARMRSILMPVFQHKQAETPEHCIEDVRSAWDILERFLADSPYICGDDLTIADFCLISTTSSLTEIVPLDPDNHANVIQWMDRLAELPYYEEMNGGAGKMLQAAFFETRKNNAE